MYVETSQATSSQNVNSNKPTLLMIAGFGLGCVALGAATACFVLPSASHADSELAFTPSVGMPSHTGPANAPIAMRPSNFRVMPSPASVATYAESRPRNGDLGFAAPDASAGAWGGIAKDQRVVTPSDMPPAQLIQGNSLRTWGYHSPAIEQVQVVLSSEGRPLDADIELWHGPDNTPIKMRVYSENAQLRPFSAVLETPRGPNTVAIRNMGQMEFPITANALHGQVDRPSSAALAKPETVQGGALKTYPFDPRVDSVEVLIMTDGRPLNAKIELLQGPNNNKQVIELYAEDGRDRPFFTIIETPGAGNVIRVVNTAPVEFPMQASVVPHSINNNPADVEIGGDVIIGGDVGF